MNTSSKRNIEYSVTQFLNSTQKETPFVVGLKLDEKDVSLNQINLKSQSKSYFPINLIDLKKLVEAYRGSTNTVNDQEQGIKQSSWEICGRQDLFPVGKMNQEFFSQTVPNLSKTALKLLGLNPSVLKTETVLHSIAIMETGSSLDFKPSSLGGESIKMILQIPVDGGHEGGRIKVELHNQIELLEMADSSNTLYYLTAFYSGCEAKIEQVTFGWKVAMIFHIALEWLESPCQVTPKQDLPTFLTVKGLHGVLKKWTESRNAPPFIVLLLEYRYSSSELKFSKLKGRDRHLALLLGSAGIVDVHLSNMLRRESKSRYASVEESSTDDDSTVELEIVGEEIFIDHWIGTDGQKVNCKELEVDVDSQVIRFSRRLFGKSYEDEFCQTALKEGSPSTTVDRFSQAVLLIWPKSKSFEVLLQGSFCTALDQLEQSPDLEKFRQMVDFCCKNTAQVWFNVKEREERTRRLLELCVRLQASDEGLTLLLTLGKHYLVRAKGIIQRDRAQSEGIRSKSVAIAIAKLVAFIGYDDNCEKAIKKILTPSRAEDQIENFAHLAIALFDLGCVQGGRSVGSFVSSLILTTPYNMVSRLSVEALITCTGMIFQMRQFEAVSPPRLQSLRLSIKSLPLSKLFHIVKGVDESFASLLRTDSSWQIHQRDLHRHLVDCPLTKELAIDIMLFFLRLGDAILLKSLTFNILNQNEQAVIKAILSSSEVWSIALLTGGGKWALRLLVNNRLHFLETLTIPTFSWIQNTTAIIDEQVEEFLQSSNVRSAFTGFDSVENAETWIKDNFGPDQIQHGHSAKVTIDNEEPISCFITKTKDLFYHQLEEFSKSRIELKALRDRKRRCLGPDEEPRLQVADAGHSSNKRPRLELIE